MVILLRKIMVILLRKFFLVNHREKVTHLLENGTTKSLWQNNYIIYTENGVMSAPFYLHVDDIRTSLGNIRRLKDINWSVFQTVTNLLWHPH